LTSGCARVEDVRDPAACLLQERQTGIGQESMQ
jgi:murein L,D-transpeptidase YcbB/YkuD